MSVGIGSYDLFTIRYDDSGNWFPLAGYSSYDGGFLCMYR